MDQKVAAAWRKRCKLTGNPNPSQVRCRRSSTQGHERKKRDDEAVAILKRTALMDRVQLLCTIHEFHAERVELVAGHEMKSCRSGRRLGCQALRDRQQP